MLFLLVLPCQASKERSQDLRKDAPVALPGQTLATDRALTGGMGIGPMVKGGCKTITEWQGNAQYFYSPSISGGAAFRLFGGDIDNSYTLVYQRYFLNARYHFRSRNADIFIGPVIGLDNANISSLRDELAGTNTDSIVAASGQSYCNDRFQSGGVGGGWEAGMGFRLNELAGLHFGHTLEFTTQGRSVLGLSAGSSFDLWRVWGRMQSNTLAAFLTIDGVWSLDLVKISGDWSLLVGAVLGF